MSLWLLPKGSGTSLRRNFLSGEGINASFAVFNDATGRATERTIALGIGIGAVISSRLRLKKEVFSDLVGERGVLMGALAGIMEASMQPYVSTANSPSEAFNETVEELTEVYPSR